MKVFIAGASGVLGRRLVQQFVARGHSVIGQVRSPKAEIAVREAGGEPRHADLFDAESLAYFFVTAQEQAGDLSGVVDVRAAAGGKVELMDIDEAELLAPGGGKFAQAEGRGFIAGDIANVDGAILQDNFVRPTFRGFDLILGERSRVEVDRAVVLSHVERDGGHIEKSDEGR